MTTQFARETTEGLWMPPETTLQDTIGIPLLRSEGTFAYPTVFGGATMPGSDHTPCEDVLAICQSAQVMAVCDGIGGAPHGAFAARVAANVTTDSYERGLALGAAVEQAARAVDKLCGWLHAPQTGTTVVAAALHDHHVSLAWLGDSLALLLKGGAGELHTLTAADRVAGTNQLTACLGSGCHRTPHTADIRVEPGDVLLLCTDGVWAELDRDDLAVLLGHRRLTARERAGQLVDPRRRRGGDDATAAVIEILDAR